VACVGSNEGAFDFDFSVSSPYAGNYDYQVYNTNGTAATGDDTVVGVAVTGATGGSSVTLLPAGEYYVVVSMTNSPFCPVTSPTVTIDEPTDPLNVTYDLGLISCITSNSGQIVINASNGWGGYTYQLINTTTGNPVQSFDTNNIITDLVAGDYELTVRDAGGCLFVDNFTLASPTPINASVNTIAFNQCEGDEMAVIEVINVTGGQGNPASYKYTLTYPSGQETAQQSSNVFTNLGAGNYIVTVYDDYSCNEQFPVTITDPSDVEATASAAGIITCTNPTVDITVTGVGGTGTYEYSNDGTTFVGSNVFAVIAGEHRFYVRDANGCVSEPYIVTVAELEPLTVTLDTSGGFVTCFNEENAVLSATATGGLGNYVYELLDAAGVVVNGPQTSNIFTNIAPGSYSIRVISGDCSAQTSTHIITNPEELVATGTPTPVSCNGGSNGTITIDAEGGTGDIVYEIDSAPGRFQSQNVFTNLAAGIYNVTVQDQRGCFTIVTVEVEEPQELTVSLLGNVVQQTCIQDPAPSFTIEINGGTGPYRVSLNGNAFINIPTGTNTYTFENLDPGQSYTVIVRDANDCRPVDNITITTDEPIDMQLQHTVVYDCSGDVAITGTIDEQYSNEVVFTLTGPESHTNDTGAFIVNTPGIYTLEVEHVDGCIEMIDQIEIEDVEPLSLIIDTSQINLLIANPSGGIGPYEFSIDNSDFYSQNEFVINQTRNYTIVVRDSRGCEVTMTVLGEFITIEVPNFFTPDGDGTNDYWYPINVEDYHEVVIYIFDRYGRQLRIFEGSHEGWDGIYDGKPLPTGDYWYTINFKERSGEKKKMMGHFTLYRK
ncbi:T9SS type B sorting domain-containing protein, partial [Tenacibaculum sp. IB213877]|uniref:T9SS type B sorting domain-containing protein n=1 Tax=Tenacibaculum sp. IB213877 TaxID=3097351 RepID=UPI002A59D180